MAYVAPSTKTTGTLITAAVWNQDVVANPIAINAGAIAIAGQAAYGIPYASSTTQFGILAAGPVGSPVVSKGTGAAPGWGPNPIAMAIALGG